MTNSPPTFGKRGARASAPARATPAPEPEPSAAYLELAAAARASLRAGAASEPEDRPATAAPSGPEDDMRLFVGPRWGAYRALWARMQASPGLRFRRSFFAAAFSSLWLLYRKQYGLGLVVLAAQAAAPKIGPLWSALIDLVVVGFCGQFGMSIVLISGARKIARLRASGASPEIAAIRIRSAGGVNWVAAICGAALLSGVALADFTGEFAQGGGADEMQTLLDALRSHRDGP